MTTSDPSLIRILLLEDEEFIRGTIRLMLRPFSNIDLREGGDGTEGLKLLERGFCPDVVLCDVHMAPMDGLGFLRQIRGSRDPVKLALPVIMLTAASDPETVQAAAAFGLSSYLVKPVALTRLTERLNAVLRSAPGRKTLSKGGTKDPSARSRVW